jgi:peptidoglycan hydrolase-like protein with peptidoglycan-binding domain
MTYLRMTTMACAVALAASACGGGETAESSTTSSVVFTETTTTTAVASTTLATTTTTTVPAQKLSATSTTFQVQVDLKALGFFDGQIDGIAGEETQAALRSFQTQQGIGADGEFGSQTDGAMVPLLVASVEYVKKLQEELKDLGLYTNIIDGKIGKGTKAAIEKLQESCDLEVTGVIDIATRICLARAG